MSHSKSESLLVASDFYFSHLILNFEFSNLTMCTSLSKVQTKAGFHKTHLVVAKTKSCEISCLSSKIQLSLLSIVHFFFPLFYSKCVISLVGLRLGLYFLASLYFLSSLYFLAFNTQRNTFSR